jgi:hypothetical protein
MTTDSDKVLAGMDDAAKIARQELMDEVIAKAGNVKDVANWVKKYYLTVGYKRLCRILLELVKE